MNRFTIVLTILAFNAVSFANDGGMSGIKVDQIKMREQAIKNGQVVLVRKIANPNFVIEFEGGEAEKLRQILPPEHNVALSPETSVRYSDSFRSLGVYSEASNKVTAKALVISCTDSKLDYVGKEAVIRKLDKTSCTITIDAPLNVAEILGDVTPFEPTVCK